MQSCHDLSEGGLAVALAEMALAGRLGASVDLRAMVNETWAFHSADRNAEIALFSESNGRLLLEVAPADGVALEQLLAGQMLLRIGQVSAEETLTVQMAATSLIELTVEALVAAWK